MLTVLRAVPFSLKPISLIWFSRCNELQSGNNFLSEFTPNCYHVNTKTALIKKE